MKKRKNRSGDGYTLLAPPKPSPDCEYSVGILPPMADTTIKVDTQVRDRLAILAAERDMTMRALLKLLADATPTQAELQKRQDEAVAYIRAHLVPDFNDEDLAAGKEIWESIRTGSLPLWKAAP